MIKVLIIEDEQMIARMYQKGLESGGFQVITADGGKDGIEKVKSEKPDIVLCDIMMPEINGMEVLEKLKADPTTKNVPVVMLTNLSGEHDAALARSKGAHDFWVKKDAQPKELGGMIKKLLNIS